MTNTSTQLHQHCHLQLRLIPDSSGQFLDQNAAPSLFFSSLFQDVYGATDSHSKRPMICMFKGFLSVTCFSQFFFLLFRFDALARITMPMKRTSDSSARDGLFLLQPLTKTLCSSPEETDFIEQTHSHQEDDSGIKSGNYQM